MDNHESAAASFVREDVTLVKDELRTSSIIQNFANQRLAGDDAWREIEAWTTEVMGRHTKIYETDNCVSAVDIDQDADDICLLDQVIAYLPATTAFAREARARAFETLKL